jgi:hypothetical protein
MKIKLSIILFFGFYFISCQQNKSVAYDEMKKDSTASNSIADGSFNHIARYWSGLHDSANTKLEQFKEWKKFSADLDSSFSKLERKKFSVVETWAGTELQAVNKNINTVFYPFSGPDFYYANHLFPDAKRYIMVGLEPVGDARNLEHLNDTTLNVNLKKIENSLFSITNFGFFRTIAMKDNFNKQNLNGLLTLLYLFTERRGYEIVGLQRVVLTNDGTAKPYQLSDSVTMKKNVKGVKMIISKNNQRQELYYFSFDLSNGNYKLHPEFEKFVLSQKDFCTYLKAASCLMHKSFFSNIRNLILNNSTAVLQDDSGIPIQFFAKEKWNTTLYGMYTGTIDLFKGDEQPDLMQLYKDSSKVKPLPFGIGYKYFKGTSNLQLAVKK